MPAILPAIDIESDRALVRHFLPYQRAWILDNATLRLAEKSVRIGWTYADAFKNVRKRLAHSHRDYLFTTKDFATALEYVKTCRAFAELFKVAKHIVSQGQERLLAPGFDTRGRRTGLTREVKAGMIKFDNGSRILAFSSNPNALRAFGGDVGMDEFAFHPAAEELWAAASGRITWGFDLGVWSSCHGENTLFNAFVREAQSGSGGWSYYRVTLLDAIEMGLVEKINRRRAAPLSREQFLADCQRRARLPEVFAQEYLCAASSGAVAIVPWAVLARCQQDYELERWHLEAEEIESRFGAFTPHRQLARENQIQQALAQAFPRLWEMSGSFRLGFDVAASGAGDLAVMYVDRQEQTLFQLRALFTCRTQDWHFLKTVLALFLRRLPSATAAGDETGLGRQICWEAQKQFPGRFQPVNFRSEKSALGFALMHQLSLGQKIIPRAHPDIAADYFALNKSSQGSRWVFSENRNPLNPASHCDLAWAGALSTRAAQLASAPGAIHILPATRAHRR